MRIAVMTGKPDISKLDDRVLKDDHFDDFERLANGSQDAIYHYDIDSGQFLFVNRKFRSIFRIPSDAQITAVLAQMLDRIHPEDRRQALPAVTESLKAGKGEGEVEYRVFDPNGTIRFLQDRWSVLRNASGAPTAVQGFIRDITEKYQSEIQFIESKQNAPIGNYIVQEGRFRYVNPQFVTITGYREDELIDRDPMTLVHEDYRDHVRRSAVAMLKGDSLTPYEFCVFDKMGTTHWIMETVTPILYKNRRAVLGYFMDITPLHQMKDNLSTLGLMVGTLSHSLRSCLTGLNASLFLIERGFYRDKPAQIEEGLDVTKLMADRIRKLVMDILYYSKERDLELEEVEVWQFANEVAILIGTRIRAANIEFITDFAYDSGKITIDKEVVHAALVNILENAMEACIEDDRELQHQIRFSTRVDEVNVYFDISDNGPGMEKDNAGKIFQLFHSTKGKRGTGIGLFVTRKAILKHGGNITVDSSPDKGAAFHITLPRNPNQA
jgi:PAS domain S-box-containing protein